MCHFIKQSSGSRREITQTIVTLEGKKVSSWCVGLFMVRNEAMITERNADPLARVFYVRMYNF